jgi:GH24 family phage-related lysozyme (muramidase)
MINESSDSIHSKFQQVLDKIKNQTTESKKKILTYFITSLLAISPATDVVAAAYDSGDTIAKEIVDASISDDVKKKFKEPTLMRTSKAGLKRIKVEEGVPGSNGKPALKVYKIGDGKLTVGWGHAEDIGKTKMKLHQKITLRKAEQLFRKDIQICEKDIRNIFKEWDKEGLDVDITQDQFDALISMRYNMGLAGLKRTQFFQHLKNKQFKKAGKAILHANVSSKFPGLESRRKRESNLWLSYLDKSKKKKN